MVSICFQRTGRLLSVLILLQLNLKLLHKSRLPFVFQVNRAVIKSFQRIIDRVFYRLIMLNVLHRHKDLWHGNSIQYYHFFVKSSYLTKLSASLVIPKFSRFCNSFRCGIQLLLTVYLTLLIAVTNILYKLMDI